VDTSERKAIVAGSLYGALADPDNLRREPDKEELGSLALDSDGSFGLVVVRENTVTVVTDAGGSIPVYYGKGPKGLAVGTAVHHVASCSGCTTIDEVSVVDYLLNATVCYPYSWYEEIRMAPPGSVCSLDLAGERETSTYWLPTEPDDVNDSCDTKKWGARLRTQVSSAIEHGIRGKETGRLLYSGGSDSRAVLSLIPKSFNCTPTTVLDGKNREYRLAKRSANLLGWNLDWVERPKDYYRSAVRERIDTLGPGRDFQHTHIFGSVARYVEDVDVIMGGYLSDTLFKTQYMKNIQVSPSQPEKLAEPTPGKIKESTFEATEVGDVFRDLVTQVRKRRRSHHQRLKEVRPLTAGNWHRLYPVTNTLAYGSYLACRDIKSEVVEPFFFSQTYQLAAKMPDTGRVDSRVFREAFAGEMGLAGFWPTSSGRIPRFGGTLGHEILRFIKRWRTLKEKVGLETGYQGSWSPNRLRNNPVQPEEHFSKQECELLYHRMRELLKDGESPKGFFEGSEHKQAKVRALALGFSVS
jgi:asparagine synthetase B (glutamine-hydrolysing)